MVETGIQDYLLFDPGQQTRLYGHLISELA